jgi:hypothetical protein
MHFDTQENDLQQIGKMTLSIITLSMKAFFATLSTNEIQNKGHSA